MNKNAFKVLGLSLLLFTSATVVAPRGFAAPIQLSPGDEESGKIFTPCVFDGVSLNCLLDTGSALSNVMNTGVFTQYPPLASTQVEGAAGDPENCATILLKTMTAADMTLPQHEVQRCNGPSPGNVLGIDAFQGKTLHIDFRARSLDANDAPIPATLERNSLTLSPDGLIVLPIGVSGQDQQAVWDTGAGLTSVDETFAQAHPEAFIFVQKLPGGHDSTGHLLTYSLYKMNRLTIGGKTLTNILVLSFDFSPIRVGIGDANFILGYNVITQMDWYIDLRTRTWALY